MVKITLGYLFANLQVIVHRLDGLENDITPKQIISRSKYFHLCAQRFDLNTVHPTMPEDTGEWYPFTRVQMQHATNQTFAFCVCVLCVCVCVCVCLCVRVCVRVKIHIQFVQVYRVCVCVRACVLKYIYV